VGEPKSSSVPPSLTLTLVLTLGSRLPQLSLFTTQLPSLTLTHRP